MECRENTTGLVAPNYARRTTKLRAPYLRACALDAVRRAAVLEAPALQTVAAGTVDGILTKIGGTEIFRSSGLLKTAVYHNSCIENNSCRRSWLTLKEK